MAASFSIEAVFKAVDRMSNPMRGINRNTSKFSRAIRTDFAKAQRSVDQFSRNLKRNAGTAVRNFTFAVGVAATVAVGSFITEASKIEDAVAGFTPLLGGVEKANELVDQLNQTAATTPFQFDNISAAAKQLLPVMNQDIERTVDTFRMLGDTAGGNAQKLESITRGFTKAMLKGKVDLESLNMIAEAGVPIFDQLAGELGVTTQDMFKMVSAGKVTTDALTNTFRTMTSEGGLFFNGMEIASRTLTGKLSTLKDNIALTAASLGSNLLPVIKPMVDQAIEMAGAVRLWANENKELINNRLTNTLKNLVKFGTAFFKVATDIFQVLKFWSPIILTVVAAMTLYKGVLLATAVATKGLVAVMGLMRAAQFIYIAATQGMAAAQAAFNGVAMANPIGLIVTAIGLLIGAGILLVKNWDTVSAFLIKVWGQIKEVGISVWEGIKLAFSTSVEFMKRVFFTFADLILTTYGNIFKSIIEGASRVGKFFGFDTTGIDNVISKIEDVQRKVREQSFIGGSVEDTAGAGAEPIQAPVSSAERAASNRETFRGELTVRDPNNRTEITRNPRSRGFRLQMADSGDM